MMSMSQASEHRVIEAIIRLEVKLDHVMARIDAGDDKFDQIERRIHALEMKNSQFMGVIAFIAVVLPLAIRFFLP